MARERISQTKTAAPTAAGMLARKRLFAVLDKQRRKPVIWVCGPPGCGKTTLVASYLEARQLNARWYHLDKSDSDVASFFFLMGNARISTRPGAALPLYTQEYQGDLQAFSRRYFQSLYQQLKSPFVLVLDNYQELSAYSGFHDVLLEASAEIPPESTIVVISRNEPPSAMVRLRANQTLELLSWKQLQLTRIESDAIALELGMSLSRATLKQLYEKTEGWAAGLVLLLKRTNTTETLAELPESKALQLVFDYLAGELFEGFDARAQEMLLKTSFLPDLTTEAAVALTGDRQAGAILAKLHDELQFVSVKQSPAGRVFQFHPLLQQFLRERASLTYSAGQCLELHRRCSALMEAAGDADGAFDMLRQVSDWPQAAGVVLHHAEQMLQQGRAETLERWLEAIPEEQRVSDPWLLYWQARCRFFSTPRSGRILFEQAYELFLREAPDDKQGLLLACSGAMDAIIYELDDFSLLDRWITIVSVLIGHQPELPWPDVQARITASMFMSLVFRQPHHAEIRGWSERAVRETQNIPDTNSRLLTQLLVSINLNYTGQYSKVREYIDGMRKVCDSPQVSPLANTVLKDVESMHYMLTGEYDKCLRATYEGLAIGESNAVHSWDFHLLSNGVGGALGAGDLDTAQELLLRMDDVRDRSRRLDRAQYHTYWAWYWMLREDLGKAYQEQKLGLKMAVECGCPFYEAVCHLAMGQLLAKSGEEQRAITHLRRVRSLAKDISNKLLEFMSLLTFAHLAFEHRRERHGLNSLRYALGVGREFGFTNFLWWLPDVMAKLCTIALEHDIETEYVKRLIRERDLMPEPPPLALSRWPWRFRIRTFGGFHIERDDQPLGVVAKLQHKPLELLKGLVGLGAENVMESKLAGAIWPRIDLDYAHKSLTTNLHRLRKILGEDKAVLLKYGRLTLNSRYCCLDIRQFELLTKEADHLFSASGISNLSERVAGLENALLDIYQGPFMEGEADRPWFTKTRERLRNRFLRTIGDIAYYWEECNDWHKAITCYRRSLEVDPLAEGFYRRLMLCYRAAGRQAEAVEVYDICKRTFRSELAVAPSSETTAIYETLLQDIQT